MSDTVEKVSDLESKYLENKLLSDGVQTTIKDIRINKENNPVLFINDEERIEHIVKLNSIYDPETENGLTNLYYLLGLSPDEPISSVKNKSVEISYSKSQDKNELILSVGEGSVKGSIVQEQESDSLSNNLTPEQTRKLELGHQALKSNKPYTQHYISNISAENGKLNVHINDYTISFDEEYSYTDEPETQYEKLIEYIGQGSIQNLNGGSIYLIHEDNIYHRVDQEKDIDNLPSSWDVITKLSNGWIITAEKPRKNVKYSSKSITKSLPNQEVAWGISFFLMGFIDLYLLISQIYNSSPLIILTVFIPLLLPLFKFYSSKGYYLNN